MHQIFMIIMVILIGMAYLFGTTYNVINIFVYYILVPSTWIYLISRKTNKWINIISISLLLAFILHPDIRANCNYFFQRSVDFLNWSAALVGSNYIDMSVYICVLIVGLVYIILIPLTLPIKTTKILLTASCASLVLYLIFIYPNFKDLLLFGLKDANVKY